MALEDRLLLGTFSSSLLFFDDRLTLCEQTKVDAKVKITVTDTHTHTQVELSFFLAVTVSVMLVVVNDDCDGWVINGTQITRTHR